MVITVSDSRTLTTDAAGGYVCDALVAQGHHLIARNMVADAVAPIRAMVLDAVERGDIDILILIGGTGIAPSDVTPDAVVPLFTKHIPGFGEIFRRLLFDSIGPEAMLSRAHAGVITRVLVFTLPGAPAACKLAIDMLIGPVIKSALQLLHSP